MGRWIRELQIFERLANASYKRQERNEGVTEIVEIANRGHSLTIDSGWREVCDKALEFVKRFV
jgi:non-heme chloroperoxidase